MLRCTLSHGGRVAAAATAGALVHNKADTPNCCGKTCTKQFGRTAAYALGPSTKYSQNFNQFANADACLRLLNSIREIYYSICQRI